MPNYQDGFGKSGIASMKEDSFREKFEWQLKEFPKDKKRTILEIPLAEYFEIGIYCIRNEISINQFIKDALKLRVDFHKDFGHCKIGELVVSKRNKDIKKEKKKIEQGSLF